ncbi:MAG: hypothetical protein ACP5NF_00390 [Thermoanaerobaculum sp.]
MKKACLVVTLWAGLAPAGAAPPFPSLRVVASWELPPELRVADVRFASERSVFLVGPSGLVRWELVPGKSLWALEAGLGAPGVAAMVSRVAYSDPWVVTAGPVRDLAWRNRRTGAFGRSPLGLISDVDVANGKVAVVGCQKDEANRWCVDGSLVFWGDLTAPRVTWQPLYLSPLGASPWTVLRCGALHLGQVRFLPDGGLAAFPGFEEGLFFYGPDGKLRRVVPTASLGFSCACDLSEEASDRVIGSGVAQLAWLNTHTVADELLPAADGAVLVLRSPPQEKVRWELLLVRTDGTTAHQPLPLPGERRNAFLDGDASGRKVVFLERVYRTERDDNVPAPRLWLLEW